MKIQEKTKEALSTLFADLPSSEPEPDDAEEGEKKPVPRGNGIIEQDYLLKGFHLDVQLESEQLLEAVQIIGVDWIKDDQLEVVYDFSRYDFDLCRTVLRTRLPRSAPQLPSITPIYTGASWHERETHDFFGIIFDGHPHLVPLLLPEDADFHPLLKDFKA